MMLKKVGLSDAIGTVLAHDVTKVVRGKYKGPLFRRGHVIREEDISELLQIGKEHLYIMELEEGEVHEEEAALRIARAIAGPGLEIGEVQEGRINLKAQGFGLLKVNVALLREINSIGEISIATLHNNTVCQKGTVVVGEKVTPLIINEDKLKEVERLCHERERVVKVIPIRRRSIGVVITGNEVFTGRVEDKFAGVIAGKVAALGSEVTHVAIVPDDISMIAEALRVARDSKCEVIVICGGLAVDADDVTVAGVRSAGADIISYGSPVMPGAMFLYALWGRIPVVGAQAAVIYNPATIFDLVLPRILAGEEISRADIVELGHGGLCLNCKQCSFPVCPFGK
jgi:molybdopterin biosynthesis enzyme